MKTTVEIRSREPQRRVLRRRSPFVACAVTSLALVLSGCTEQRLLENDRTPEPSPSRSGTCARLVLDQPELPAWEINETLPIKDVDVAFTQRELRFEAGGGPCADDPAVAVVDECRLVAGLYDPGSDLILWRGAFAFADQEIAAGARHILAEEVTGRTVDDETFHWRAVAVEYPDSAVATASPAWNIINACDDLQLDQVYSDAASLSEGDEPYLVAKIVGSTLYLVETWIGTEDKAPLDDTESGLPPADAVGKMMTWVIDHAGDSSRTTTR